MAEKREALVVVEESSNSSSSNGNGRFKANYNKVVEKESGLVDDDDDKYEVKMEAFWDDGYGSESVKDYFDAVKDIIVPDCGPPRWFCPISCGRPLKNSPTLLFLPGITKFCLFNSH